MCKMRAREEVNQMLMAYLEHGGKITVTKTKRPLNSYSWSLMNMRGSIAHKGRKATHLRAAGFAKAN